MSDPDDERCARCGHREHEHRTALGYRSGACTAIDRGADGQSGHCACPWFVLPSERPAKGHTMAKPGQ